MQPIPNSVLQKTVASLETALRYNPDNLELMTSLAEAYVRIGRLDGATLALCERVLVKYPDNATLQHAQAVSYVIEQTDQIDVGLAVGKAPPSSEAIESSISILEEFLRTAQDCALVWFAWTRLCIFAGRVDRAMNGITTLERLAYEGLAGLRRVLDWAARKQTLPSDQWLALCDAYAKLGEQGMGLKMMEKAFDTGHAQAVTGPLLLAHYNEKYSPAQPDQVPEETRARFFQLMLDYGDPSSTGEWLRRAALHGWEITHYSKAYVRELVREEQFETAFELLQRMSLDRDVKELLNTIAAEYEKRDALDDAVKVLQYINNHELTDDDLVKQEESVLAREMEHSLAELHMKNGRPREALVKYVSALCLGDGTDLDLIEKIDALLSDSTGYETPAVFRLAAFFRRQKDHPKTAFYLNHILEHEPENAEALHELASLFDSILVENPQNPDLHLELGKVYLRMKRLEDAVKEFETALAIPSLAPRASRMLASAYRQLGRLREALTRFQDVEVTDRDLDSIYDLHAEFTKVEDYRSAIVALEMIHKVRADYRDVAQRLEQLESQRGSRASGEQAGDPKMRELIGDSAIGRYRHIEKIGSGGMGVVYKVLDLRLKKVVAMKILRDGLAGSSKALDRFFREARIAAGIHHRNIVDIHDYNISSINGQSYICMEFVDGPSMRELIDQHFDSTISISIDYVTEMLYYNAQVFDALQYTHEKGIIHRDIKPDNVMITAVGEAKLTDFGIVHVEEATFTPTGAMLGTPRYMSPEQVIGGKIDGRSDVYSVGVVLYEALTGSPPFLTGDISYQQVHKTPISPRDVNTMIPQSVNEFILRCLQKEPDQRFSSAREAKDRLLQILSDLGGCKKYDSMTPSGEPQSRIAAIVPPAPAMDDDLDVPASLDSDLDLDLN